MKKKSELSHEFDNTWESIYERGDQLNLYPYDSVVAFMMKNFSSKLRTRNIRVLEVGCGAGNNLWFAARQGFEVYGLDASQHAIEFARKRFDKDNLSGAFEVGSFTKLPYDDDFFDVVIDRAAITNVNLNTAVTAFDDILRVLNVGGILYSEVFSDQASSRGVLLDDGVLSEIEGPYSGAGHIYFYSKSEIESIFSDKWGLDYLAHTERKEYDSKGVEVFAHWSVVAIKK